MNPLEIFFYRTKKVSINQKHLRQFTTKTYKSLTDVSHEFITPFFITIFHNLRNGLILNLLSTRTTYCGANSILFRACQVLNKLPLFIKQSQSLLEQKQPSRSAFRKRCSEKYAPKHPCRSAISIKLFCNFIEIALRHGFSPVNLLHIFTTSIPENTPEGFLYFFFFFFFFFLNLKLI